MESEPNLEDLLRTDVVSARAEIHRLKAEVADLRKLVEATFVGVGRGIAVLTVPPETRPSNITSLREAWGAAWPIAGDAPPLFLAFGDFPIEKLEYDGNSIFAMRVPVLTTRNAAHITDMWRAVWRRTDTPHAPLVLLPGDTSLELLSDAALGERGLMRVPSGLNFGG